MGKSRLSIWALGFALLVTADVRAEPAKEDYRIGPEDILSISVWDNKDLDQVVFVRPDGKISLPLVGQVQAGGLTVTELTGRLAEQYSETIKGAQVTVGVREIRSRTVFFVGGVAKPGPLQLTQDLTFLQAIALAGGPAPTGDLGAAFVIRGEKVVPVDYLEMIQTGDATGNIRLQPGDTVVVPTAAVVFMQGEVKSPGLVRFSRELTLLRAVAQAGGFTALAAPRRVTVLRDNGAKSEKIHFDVYEMMRQPDTAPDAQLKPNDLVIVPQRLPGVLPGG
jgi:polysaccharide export outer membrane protein